MANVTNDPAHPSKRGPWPEVSSVDQIFDHGARWCVNATGHPSRDDGYPNASLHLPPFECRTGSLGIEEARDGLSGVATALEIYLARPYRFGIPRALAGRAEPASSSTPRWRRRGKWLGSASRLVTHSGSPRTSLASSSGSTSVRDVRGLAVERIPPSPRPFR
jgi:hypothetical protein